MRCKILLIGGIGAGKTTLKQKLLNQSLIYLKTQALDFSSIFIDCPGEYLEIPRHYHVLIDAGSGAIEVWAMHDATRRNCPYPPNFASAFRKPVIGIVTKIDHHDACPDIAENNLRKAGITGRIYQVSAKEGIGIPELALHMSSLTSQSS
ncbi:EutP/PduV family microcompartment system protein [Sporomusa sp.]|uniref:EutP/PduV family microcompartment system protein n=1 Tax=Sporomusa sp. TaxID=2078658 RepID=UPI002CA3675E|nr:EutP/PduV family microcompartment system protein [Sporomusa sp.]HWR44721.1 EutP/PduV family microcompartment system protein [Sporomusa sp.]